MSAAGDVVITGVGLIAAGADTAARLFQRMLDAERPAPVPPPEGAGPQALPVVGFAVRSYLDRRGLKDLSRTSRLACAAASRLGAGLEAVPASAVGVVFGTAWASLDTVVRFEREAEVEGPRFVDPILFTETVANVPAGQISIVFGWSALNVTICSGTASGLEALLRAREFLDEGRARVVVAGAGDELNRHLLRALEAAGRLSAGGPPMPHAAGADGAVGGEGACLFALESAGHAAGRGAAVLAVLGAGSMACVGGEGRAAVDRRARSLTELFEREGLAPRDLDLLVLSGNGDPRRDSLEAAVLERVFGAEPPPAVLPKAWLGETWGPSGALGVAVALEAIARGQVPPAPRDLHPVAPSVRLPRTTAERAVRHALVLDCPADSHFAAQILRKQG